MHCKRCHQTLIVKNGKVRGKQRYLCKNCGCNFVAGDGRVKQETAIKRAFAVLLYSLGKASYGFLAKLFDVTPAAVQKWLEREADRLPEPEIASTIHEIEFDEMWHFVGSKKPNNGSSKPWIVLQAEPSPGLSAIVMLQHSGDSTIKSST